jgi:transposase
MNHLIPAATQRRIIRFRKGTRTEEIAFKCGVSYSYAHMIRNAHGLLQKQTRFTPEMVKEIVSARAAKMTVAEIVKKFGMSRPTLYAILRREGYPVNQYKPRNAPPPKLAPWVESELKKLNHEQN